MPGSIQRRSKDTWSVVVDAGSDPLTGRRRQLRRIVKGNRKEAEALLAKFVYQRSQGIDIAGSKVTTGEYLERWLGDAEPRLAPTTFLRYRGIVRLHLSPGVGRTPLAKLRPMHIQALYTAMLETGLSPRTVLHAHRLLRETLKHAVQWELIPRNPTDAVAPPRAQRYEVPVFEPEDIQRIVDEAIEEHFEAIVQTAILTGLRQGELLGLRWEDIDLERAVLRVRRVSQQIPGRGFIYRQPKTHRSARPVPLSPAAVQVLRRHRAQQAEQRLAVGPLYRDRGLVFPRPDGHPLSAYSVGRVWRRVAAAAGISLRFHDLRHVHASLLLAAGVHPKVVGERLGHSDTRITLDTYSHVLPSLHEQAAAEIDRIMGWSVT